MARALARLNIAFSLGCLLSPLLAAALTPRFALNHLLVAFALLFAVVNIPLRLELLSNNASEATPKSLASTQLFNALFLLFAAILFFYGALETCLSAWLTTYALRYGQTSLVLSQYTLVLLLCGLTGGRYLASLLLKRIAEVHRPAPRARPHHRNCGGLGYSSQRWADRHAGRRSRHLPGADLPGRVRALHGRKTNSPPSRARPRSQRSRSRIRPHG